MNIDKYQTQAMHALSFFSKTSVLDSIASHAHFQPKHQSHDQPGGNPMTDLQCPVTTYHLTVYIFQLSQLLMYMTTTQSHHYITSSRTRRDNYHLFCAKLIITGRNKNCIRQILNLYALLTI